MLKAFWQSHVMNFLIETLIKSQGAKALGQIVQQGRHFVTNLCHFCNPIQWELSILNALSRSKKPSSMQIDGNVGSPHLCSLTPKSLLLQTFVQHKPWSMGHNQLKAQLGWNLVQNNLPQLATKHGLCWHSMSTCIRHWCLALRALSALLPMALSLSSMRRHLFWFTGKTSRCKFISLLGKMQEIALLLELRPTEISGAQEMRQVWRNV